MQNASKGLYMIEAENQGNEKARLDALYQLKILDTESEPEFDDFAKLASYICGTSIALISFVDEHRQWFKSKSLKKVLSLEPYA